MKAQGGQAFWHEGHTVVSDWASGPPPPKAAPAGRRQIAPPRDIDRLSAGSFYSLLASRGRICLSFTSNLGGRFQSWKSEFFALTFIALKTHRNSNGDRRVNTVSLAHGSLTCWPPLADVAALTPQRAPRGPTCCDLVTRRVTSWLHGVTKKAG